MSPAPFKTHPQQGATMRVVQGAVVEGRGGMQGGATGVAGCQRCMMMWRMMALLLPLLGPWREG